MTFIQNPPRMRSAWRDDMERVTARLEPWVRTLPDGAQYIDPESAPGPLAKIYGELLSIGYAHGWITLNDEDTEEAESAR